MEQETDTIDNAIVDTIANQIMNDFDTQLRGKLHEIIKSKDPKALRHLVRNLSKCIMG